MIQDKPFFFLAIYLIYYAYVYILYMCAYMYIYQSIGVVLLAPDLYPHIVSALKIREYILPHPSISLAANPDLLFSGLRM